MIILTGNYTFFNWLTLALCLLLLDDAALAAMAPKKWFKAREMRYLTSPWGQIFRPCLATLIVLTGVLQMTTLFWRSTEQPKPIQSYFQTVQAFRTINGYGLFAVMTTKRMEIIIEGSMDGEQWLAYDFKWKPGDLKSRPGFVAPHQPRLDWQMWFAALGDYRRNAWLLHFMEHLTRNTPVVTALIARNPFPEEPPRHVRAVLYQYHFTDRRTKRETGQWWRREYKGLYAPVVHAAPR